MIQPDDLLAPTGDLQLAFFPTDSASAVDARLAAYIAEGFAKAASIESATQRDAAARAWAYHRAYHAIYVERLSRPAKMQLGQNFEAAQDVKLVSEFGRLASRYLADFETILTEGTAPVEPTSTGSSTVPIEVVW